MAVAEAFLNSWLGPDIVDHRTYAMVGDGCLQEGLGQEIISLAGHLRLGKLTFLWDDNKMTDDGVIDIASRDDMPARFRLSGWHVQEVDGHDVEAVSAALLLAKKDPRPSMIACATIIGRGLPKIEGTRAAHCVAPAPGADRRRAALSRLAAPGLRRPRRHPRRLARDGRRSAADYDAWQARVAALPADKKRLLARLQEGRLPEGWDKPLRAFKAQAQKERKPQYGITLSSDMVDMLSDAIPELISGAPDLEGATQHKRRLKPFGAADPGGRYVHYGIREHAMGAMLNGMAAHGGVVPVGVTYLVVLRLHAADPAAGGDDEAAGAVRLQPRFHRHRPQRPDAPAGGIPGLAARHPQHAHLAPGRCGGGGRVLGDRASRTATARRR